MPDLTGRGTVLLSAALLVLCGCETGSRMQGDPFLGLKAQPTPLASGGPGGTPVQTTAGGPPPVPASVSAPSPAAIAGGTAPTPDEPRPLRMAETSATPTGLAGNSAARGASPANVTVGAPEPAVTDSTSRLQPMAASFSGSQTQGGANPAFPAVAGSSTSIATFEQAQQSLKQRGVTWQRFDFEDGQWKFQCSKPNPSTPSINRNFRTEQPFADPVAAMRAVLAQIDKDEH